MIDLDSVKDFKVLFLGDRIVDEYIYVQTIGKAVKENALSSVKKGRQVFYGGIWAAKEHLRTFCKTVDYRGGEMDMVTTRLVDEIYLRKLFVIHETRKATERWDPVDIPSYDVVVVADFGYGALTPELMERVQKESRFLAVNAQTNAPNYGFNMITKYKRADLVVVDELEARLATHEKDAPIEDVILKLGFKKIIVTMGAHGAVGFDGAFERMNAYTDKVVDTMGCGDAFLSIVAPYAAAGASMKDLLILGNAAGAIKSGIVGHSKSVTKDALGKMLNG